MVDINKPPHWCPDCKIHTYMPVCWCCNAKLLRKDDSLPHFNFTDAPIETGVWPGSVPPLQVVVPPDQMGHAFDIPTTYPDGTGSLTPYEWVQWAKKQLLYGETPLPKKV